MSYFVELPYEEPISVYRESDHGYRRSVYDSYNSYEGSHGRSYHSNAIALHVSMCCEKCVQKVRKSLKNVDDVDSVEVDMPRQRVTVRGYINPDRVLRKVRKVKKSAQFWDSSRDYATYTSGAYDSYYRPAMSSYDHEYYNRSSSYDSSYSDHHYKSYDAYRYR